MQVFEFAGFLSLQVFEFADFDFVDFLPLQA